MGFLAMGGLAAVIVSYPPITESWKAGGTGIGVSFILLVILVTAVMYINKTVTDKKNRNIFKTIYNKFGILVIIYIH